ncbi:MAG: branched-chain amino acid ABC transporter substrate-binding protein [Thermoleophilia bacterium]|nr:branched-chain amino acid ABC transporter substrate-binding protein [Thermoleophilia bacterium]
MAAIVLVAVGVAGCGAASGGAGGRGTPLTEVVIASDLPLTGSSRAQTESMVQAIEMLLKERNGKAGGVKVTYRSLDDATAQAGKWDEAKCAENVQGLAKDAKVVVLIGPMNSGCAQIQIRTANTAGLAMVSPSATAVGLTKAGGEPGEPDKYYPNGTRNFLRVALADDTQAKAGASWAQSLGVKRVFVLHDKETYGKGLADQFEGAAENLGIDVVGVEGIDPQASNYRALVPKITGAKADMVYFGGITQNNAGQVLKDLRSASKDIKFMGPDGIFEDAFVQAAGDSGAGAMATFGGIPPEKLTGKGKAFIANFTKAHGKPSAYTAYAYDSAGLALAAIERCAAGTGVTRKCVLDELFATKDFEGALGTFSMTKTGDTTLSQLTGLKVKNGAWAFDRILDIGAAT